MSEGLSEGWKRHQHNLDAPRGKIALALAKAQSMYGVAERDAEGYYSKSSGKKFASFPSVWQATMPALNACEIAVRSYTYWCILDTPYIAQAKGNSKNDPPNRAMQIFIVVEFIHSSGEIFSSELPCIPDGQGGRSTMQDLAASKTFAKRQLYQDMAFANIAEEDLDTIERSGDNGKEEERIDNAAVEAYNKLRTEYNDSCKSYYKKFQEAGKEVEFKNIVKECGFDSLRDAIEEDDMSRVVAALMDAAKKLPKPKAPANGKNGNGGDNAE